MANFIYSGMNGIANNTQVNHLNNSKQVHGNDNAKLINDTQWEMTLLKTLTQYNRDSHTSLLEKKTLNKNQGLFITYTRYDTIGTGRRLAEGITPPGDYLTGGTITGTLYQYGHTIYMTDVSPSVLNFDIWQIAKNSLQDSAIRTIDEIAKNEIHAQAGIRVYPTITEYDMNAGKRPTTSTTIPAATKISDITAAHEANYWDIYSVWLQMVYMNLISTSGTLKVAISPKAKLGFMNDPWFIGTYARNGMMDMWNSNTMKNFGPFTFVDLNTSAKAYQPGDVVTDIGTGADNTAAVALETAIIMAPDAGVRLDLASSYAGGNGVKYYSVGFVSEKTDILAQRAAAGYKFWFGVLLHTPARVAIYYFALADVGTHVGMSRVTLRDVANKRTPNIIVSKGSTAADLETLFKAAAKKLVLTQFINLKDSDLIVGDVINAATGVAFTDADLNEASAKGIYKTATVAIQGQNSAEGSTLISGSVQVIEGPAEGEMVAISSVITSPAIGEVASLTSAAVIAQTKVTYPALDDSQVVAIINGETSATIMPITNSTVYTGSANVTFTLAGGALKSETKKDNNDLDQNLSDLLAD